MARASTSGRALCLTLALPGLLSSVAAEGQGRAESSDPDWQPPMTACGHPDFQCKWSNETLTTFEWRPGLGPAYTQEEVDAIEGRERSRLQTDLGPSDPDRAPPPVTGSVGSCNEIYYERRDRVARVNGEPRTSLITFPSDGRIPALSPEGARRKQTYEEFRAQFGEFDHPELRPLAERCIVSSASSPAGVMGPPSCGCNKPGVVVRLPVEMRCIIGRNAAGCGNLGSHSQGTGWRSPGIPVSPLIGRPQLLRGVTASGEFGEAMGQSAPLRSAGGRTRDEVALDRRQRARQAARGSYAMYRGR